jgi:hypothetical protein
MDMSAKMEPQDQQGRLATSEWMELQDQQDQRVLPGSLDVMELQEPQDRQVPLERMVSRAVLS